VGYSKFHAATHRINAYLSSDTPNDKLELQPIFYSKLEHWQEICDKSSSDFSKLGDNMVNGTGGTQIHRAQEGALVITVFEADGLRWLDFGDGGVQSAIDPTDASRLVLPLNQAMLAGLLFVPTPQRVLLLGTGGGGIARLFAQHKSVHRKQAHREPVCQGDAIEQSPSVAHIARQFFDFPEPDTGWTLHIGDAQEYVACTDRQYDFIVLDIAEDQHLPQWISAPKFLGHCRQRLTDTGVLVVNLIPQDAEDFARMLEPIRQTFPHCTACLSVPTQHNILVFGFRESPDVSDVDSHVPTLTQQWNLPFAEFLQRMRNENPIGSGIF